MNATRSNGVGQFLAFWSLLTFGGVDVNNVLSERNRTPAAKPTTRVYFVIMIWQFAWSLFPGLTMCPNTI